MTLAITQEGASDDVSRHAVLQRDRADHAGILRGDVGARLGVGDEDLGQRPVSESSNCRAVAKPAALETERLACATVRQSVAGTHRATAKASSETVAATVTDKANMRRSLQACSSAIWSVR